MCGISFKHKIIFLSNHKVGSTSTEIFLRKNNLLDIRFFDKKFRKDIKYNIKHISYSLLIEHLKLHFPNVYKDINNYEIIVFTRNPIKRMISLYHYRSAFINKFIKDYPNDINNSIQKVINNNNYSGGKNFIKDITHKKLKVFKIENINDFIKYLKNKKIKINNSKFPITNKSNHKPFIKLHKNTILLIKKYFNYEIERFYPELKN